MNCQQIYELPTDCLGITGNKYLKGFSRNCGLLPPDGTVISKYTSPVLTRSNIITKCREEPLRLYQFLHYWLGYSDDGKANCCQVPKVSLRSGMKDIVEFLATRVHSYGNRKSFKPLDDKYIVLGKIRKLLMVYVPFFRFLFIGFWLDFYWTLAVHISVGSIEFENICFPGIYKVNISVICCWWEFSTVNPQ